MGAIHFGSCPDGCYKFGSVVKKGEMMERVVQGRRVFRVVSKIIMKNKLSLDK